MTNYTDAPAQLLNSSLRIVTKPRWVCYYGGPGYLWYPQADRVIGLLVPGEPGKGYSRSFLKLNADGTVTEHTIGNTGGHHGFWYTAAAGEMPAADRKVLRDHWNKIKWGRTPDTEGMKPAPEIEGLDWKPLDPEKADVYSGVILHLRPDETKTGFGYMLSCDPTENYWSLSAFSNIDHKIWFGARGKTGARDMAARIYAHEGIDITKENN